MRSPRRLLALLAVVGAGLAVAQPAAADRALPRPAAQTAVHTLENPGCGWQCDNENPNTYPVKTEPGGPAHWYTCGSDARTVDSLAPADNAVLRAWGVTLQLRYSPRCRTTWARASGLRNGNTLWMKVNPYTSYQTESGETEYPDSDFGGGGTMWSLMMNDAGQTSIACFSGTHAHVPNVMACTRNPF